MRHVGPDKLKPYRNLLAMGCDVMFTHEQAAELLFLVDSLEVQRDALLRKVNDLEYILHCRNKAIERQKTSDHIRRKLERERLAKLTERHDN